MTTPTSYHPADPESVFTYGAPHLKFGPARPTRSATTWPSPAPGGSSS